MAVVDVKITDLDQATELTNQDLFLIANPQFDQSGNPVPNKYYVSNSIAGDTLSSAFKDALINEDLSIVGEWTISNLNQPRRFVYDSFAEILSNESELDKMLNRSNGTYESSELNTLKNASLSDSLSVNYSYIPNLDYIHRLIGYVYKDSGLRIKYMPSYKGEIVYNTLTSVPDMQKMYGPHTNWQQLNVAKTIDLTGTTINIQLANENYPKTVQTSFSDVSADSGTFDIIIPLTSNTFTETLKKVVSGISINGINKIYKDLKTITSVTFSLSVVGNTKHVYGLDTSHSTVYNGTLGRFNFSFYDGDGTQIASFPDGSSSWWQTFTAAESTSAINDFGYQAKYGRPATGSQKWEFIESDASHQYGGYYKTTNTFTLNGQNTLGSYFRFRGRTGVSTYTYPYRCRAYIEVKKITGYKASSVDVPDGVNVWKRTDDNKYFPWE